MDTRRLGRALLRTIVILLVVGLGAGLVWLRPFPASGAALAALASDAAVTVTDSGDVIAFQPVGAPTATPRVGLVFYPGARVDPRAYAVIMRALAAEGVATFIVKLPFNLALLGQDRAAPIIADHPEIGTWVVGGHSLGGVAASSYAAAHGGEVRGLLLYASYPGSDLSAQLANMTVLSISGNRDGLATPAKIAANRPKLPPNARYTAIQGSVHAFFGDYGEQPGDGVPNTTREAAQSQIILASTDFLKQLGTR